MLARIGKARPRGGGSGLDLTQGIAAEKPAQRTLYWKQGPSAALRRGDWKLVISRDSRWLFDLVQDPEERFDLTSQQPEITASLARDLERWIAGLPPRLWKNYDLAPPLQVLGKPYWVEY